MARFLEKGIIPYVITDGEKTVTKLKYHIEITLIRNQNSYRISKSKVYRLFRFNIIVEYMMILRYNQTRSHSGYNQRRKLICRKLQL